MLDRTQKRVGHGRERKVGDGRREIRRRNWDGSFLRQRHETEFLIYYILHGCLCVVRYMTTWTCIIRIVNLPAE